MYFYVKCIIIKTEDLTKGFIIMKKGWLCWIELLLGVSFILLGIYTLIKPDEVLSGFFIVYGIGAIFSGVRDILYYIQLDAKTGFAPKASFIIGAVNMFLGVLFIFTNFGSYMLGLIVPLWFILTCVSRIIHLKQVRYPSSEATYWFSLISYSIGIVLGGALLTALFSSTNIARIIAIFLIVFGTGSLVLALNRLDRD